MPENEITDKQLNKIIESIESIHVPIKEVEYDSQFINHDSSIETEIKVGNEFYYLAFDIDLSYTFHSSRPSNDPSDSSYEITSIGIYCICIGIDEDLYLPKEQRSRLSKAIISAVDVSE